VNAASVKDLQENIMDVGSTSASDSGVDTNSDVGSSTSEMVSDPTADLIAQEKASSIDEMDILEPESTSACIPMTIDKENM
jgi:hypothetical protein